MPERLTPDELAYIRRALSDPDNTAPFWPRILMEGMLAERDHLAGRLGERDDAEELLESSSSFGSPRARAIQDLAREDYADLNAGVPLDIGRPLIDRHGIRWCCVGFFRLLGDPVEQPMMSTMDGEEHDYMLRGLIQLRGPLRVLAPHEYGAPSGAAEEQQGTED